jgi:hypothetical protein
MSKHARSIRPRVKRQEVEINVVLAHACVKHASTEREMVAKLTCLGLKLPH